MAALYIQQASSIIEAASRRYDCIYNPLKPEELTRNQCQWTASPMIIYSKFQGAKSRDVLLEYVKQHKMSLWNLSFSYNDDIPSVITQVGSEEGGYAVLPLSYERKNYKWVGKNSYWFAPMLQQEVRGFSQLQKQEVLIYISDESYRKRTFLQSEHSKKEYVQHTFLAWWRW